MTTEATPFADIRLFDHHNPVFSADPFPTYKALGGQPVTWVDSHGGFWLVTGYEEVAYASREVDIFLSGGAGVSIPELSPIRSIPIEFDGPQVQAWRKVLLGEMSPGAMRAREDAIRAMAIDCVEQFASRGSADLVEEFATPLPARSLMGWLGMEEARWHEFVTTVHTFLHAGGDPEVTAPAAIQLFLWLDEEVTARREGGLRDDAISRLVEHVHEDEVLAYAFTLIVAGLDTTSAGLGNAVVTLGQDDVARHRLAESPEVLPQAVEELLRYESPLQMLARTAAVDTELGGVEIKAGDRLALCWAAANRDGTKFENPDVLDIDRAPNPHIAFGTGLHRCLGSNLARTTMRVGLEELLKRIPDYEIEGIERYPDAGLVFAPTTVKIRFTPA